MFPFELDLEFENLLNSYKSKKNRIRAYAIEKSYLSTYDIAEHFNLTQSWIVEALS
jgi:hypothetical protein